LSEKKLLFTGSRQLSPSSIEKTFLYTFWVRLDAVPMDTNTNINRPKSTNTESGPTFLVKKEDQVTQYPPLPGGYVLRSETIEELIREGLKTYNVTSESTSIIQHQESLVTILDEDRPFSDTNKHSLKRRHSIDSATKFVVHFEDPSQYMASLHDQKTPSVPDICSKIEIGDNEFDEFECHLHSTQRPRYRFHKERW
jgi:hypothetical protein